MIFILVALWWSFSLGCENGLYHNETGQCLCLTGYYGSNCSHSTLSCDTDGTMTFDQYTGECVCKEGYSGTLCNECADSPENDGGETKMYICYPTGYDEYPYALIAVSQNTLSKYMYSSPTNIRAVLPLHKETDSTQCSCDCRLITTGSTMIRKTSQYRHGLSYSIALGTLVDTFVSARSVFITNTNTNGDGDGNTVLIALGSVTIGMFALLILVVVILIYFNHQRYELSKITKKRVSKKPIKVTAG